MESSSSNSTAGDGEIYEIPGLECGFCGHDLDHFAYDVRSHPGGLPIPVCLLCFDGAEEDLEDLQRKSINSNNATTMARQ
jgi:hypothetical protein